MKSLMIHAGHRELGRPWSSGAADAGVLSPWLVGRWYKASDQIPEDESEYIAVVFTGGFLASGLQEESHRSHHSNLAAARAALGR
jgi:hypothetical protein